MHSKGPVGIFDSGYGGLTVFKSIRKKLPQYDYLYLGDNARAPYGNRSFETVHEYTWQCTKWLFQQGCPLVILACNTASAKALRTIQQRDLPAEFPHRRVLGVIRPTAEVVGSLSKSQHIGVLGTKGTIESNSYPLEIHHFFPDIQIFQQACPLWVHLIENNEYQTPEADYFIWKHLKSLLGQSAEIDTILLACTHYPIIEDKIRKYIPKQVRIVAQGEIVATSLADYLQRHPELESRLGRSGNTSFFTTDDPAGFEEQGSIFFGQPIQAKQVAL